MEPLADLHRIVQDLIAEACAEVKRREAVMSVIDAQYHRGGRDYLERVAEKIRAAQAANPVMPLHGFPADYEIPTPDVCQQRTGSLECL